MLSLAERYHAYARECLRIAKQANEPDVLVSTYRILACKDDAIPAEEEAITNG
jgi:hypothetical protein